MGSGELGEIKWSVGFSHGPVRGFKVYRSVQKSVSKAVILSIIQFFGMSGPLKSVQES